MRPRNLQLKWCRFGSWQGLFAFWDDGIYEYRVGIDYPPGKCRKKVKRREIGSTLRWGSCLHYTLPISRGYFAEVRAEIDELLRARHLKQEETHDEDRIPEESPDGEDR